MSKTIFYMELSGDITSQVYKLKATNWQEAKEEAWEQLQPGDSVAECTDDAIEIVDEDPFGNKNYGIIENKCARYATLGCGVWVDLEEYGGKGENFRKNIYYFSDEEDEYLGANGKPYDFDIIRREIEKQKREEEEEEKDMKETKFYIQLNRHAIINYIQEIHVETWKEAKEKAFSSLEKGNLIAECEPNAIEDKENVESFEYYVEKIQEINKEKCIRYATLECGVEIDLEEYGGEGKEKREDIWYYSDAPKEYLGADGKPYDINIIRKKIERQKEEGKCFYKQINNGQTSHVYKLNATTWKEAKEEAIKSLKKGDSIAIAECVLEAIKVNGVDCLGNTDTYINEERCAQYATLKCGADVDLKIIGIINVFYNTFYKEDAYYFSDAPKEYLDADGKPYNLDIIREEIESIIKAGNEEEEEEEEK